MGTKLDIENLLAEGHTIQIEPQGYSMYPMFLPKRDMAILKSVPPESLKKGDVVLYRREGSILVLHRIQKIREEGFYMLGDSQWEIEGPLKKEQIKGKLVAFVRKGKEIPADNLMYVIASRVWLFACPLRRPLIKAASGCYRIWKKMRTGAKRSG